MGINGLIEKNKLVWLLTGLVGTMVLGLLMFLPVDLAENLFIHHSAQTYPLNYQLEASQSFTASRNKLKAVDLRFKKINDLNHPVKLTVRRGEVGRPGSTAWQVSFNSLGLANDRFYRFYFPVQPNSKNEIYRFSLRAEASTQSASLSPIIADLDAYSQGQAYINGEKQAGDLLFRPVYQVSLFKLTGFYINKIVFGKPGFLNKYLVFGLVLALGAGMVLVAAGVLRTAWLLAGERKAWFRMGLVWLLIIVSLVVIFYQPSVSFVLERI